MSNDTAQSAALRPWTVPAGVAAGFVTAGSLVLHNVLALVQPTTFVMEDGRTEGFAKFGMTIGASVGTAIAVVVAVVVAIAGVRALAGSHGWRIALAALAGWQMVSSLFGAVANRVNDSIGTVHIKQPSPALYFVIAAAGALCLLLLVLPATNQWYRAQRPAKSTVAGPGWYPVEDGVLRWWDGATWTEHTHRFGTAGDQPTPGTHD